MKQVFRCLLAAGICLGFAAAPTQARMYHYPISVPPQVHPDTAGADFTFLRRLRLAHRPGPPALGLGRRVGPGQGRGG